MGLENLFQRVSNKQIINELLRQKNMVTVFFGHPVSKNAFHFRGAIGYIRPIYTIRQNCAFGLSST